VSNVVVLIPAGLRVEAFWWNWQQLAEADVVPLESDAGGFRISRQHERGKDESLLTVDFHSKSGSRIAWSDEHRFDCPSFPADVWVEQSVWELVLPYDQHLFTRPAGYSLQSYWKRDAIFWSRVPRQSYADLDQWISAAGGPPQRNEFSQGNSYVVSRFGPSSTVSFRSMSRSLVVLFGAGLALGGGLLLLKLPATRNVMTLLAAAFCLSVIQMWYRSPVQLLLQPAILGSLLAVGAALIESSFKRGRGATAFTLSTNSDFIIPSASVSSVREAPAALPDSEEATRFRHPAAAGEPVSSSDSGSRS
jgi:hypothetical protein